MTIVIGSSSGGSSGATAGIDEHGAFIPADSFTNLSAALADHQDTLIEIPYFGDSTAAAGPSPVQTLRALALDAGITDGGRGVASPNETALGSGENLAPLVTSSGTYDVGGNSDLLYTDHAGTTVAGAFRTWTGKGTAIRLQYTKNSGYGRFTYEIDGGAAVTVDAAAGVTLNAQTGSLIVTGLSEGTHTVKITNLDSGKYTKVVPEFLRAAGIVFHKNAVSGSSIGSWFDYTRSTNASFPNTNAQAALGLAAGVGSTNGADWTVSPAAKPVTRNVKAAIHALGINNQQGNTDETTIAATLATVTEGFALFVRMCRAAGADPILVIPHLEYANNSSKWSGRMRQALAATARAHSVPYVDNNIALGNPNVGLYSGAPHLVQAAYDLQANLLWDRIFARLLAGEIT